MRLAGSDGRNLLAVTLPELLWGFASALTIEGPMPAAFAAQLGADEGFLGTWALIGALGTASAMLFTGWYVPALPRKLPFIVISHAVTGALYLPVALLARLGDGGAAAQVGALAGFAIFVLSLGFLLPAWLAFVGVLFPEAQRTRVLGIVFVVNRVGGIVGGFAAERLLSLPWSGADLSTLLWGLAAAASVLGALPFLWAIEPASLPQPRPRLGAHLAGLVDTLARQPALRRFVALDCLVLAGYVALNFYGDVALRHHGIAEHHAGFWIAAGAAAQLGGALLVTVLGPRLVPRHGLVLGAACAAAAAATSLVASSPAAFTLVAALAGVFLVSRQTCHGPQVLRLAADHDPTAALGLGMAAASAAQGVLPYAAGRLMPVTGFPPVFAAVAGLALLGALLLATRASDRPVSDVCR
jgi:predicted MFS family arabinose efflux permease